MGRKHKKNHKRTMGGGGGGWSPTFLEKYIVFFLHIKKINVERTVPRSPFFGNNVKVNIEDWRSRIALIPSKTM